MILEIAVFLHPIVSNLDKLECDRVPQWGKESFKLSYVIPYKFKSSQWLKLQHSDWRANLVKDFCLKINFPPMRALEFIRDHVTFKPLYHFSYHMKAPYHKTWSF